jgi:Na+/proline symporter
MSLNLLDWFIIIIYLAAMIGLSFFLARGQKTARDYYLGGNKTAPLPIALSTMATQCSTNSLLGAPAFVAFAAGGGLIWLQYSFPVFAGFFHRRDRLRNWIGINGLPGPALLGGRAAAGRHHGSVRFFVLQHFPHGLIGLVMVGLVAAAMSSLDSTLNALSALSMQDLVKSFAKKDFSLRTEMLLSKMLTVFWGVVCLTFSFYVGDVSQTIIESVNKIGSLINGPLLAVFLMGMLSRRVNGQGALLGLIVGFSGNLWLWRYAPDISWLWWNVIGFLVAFAAGYVMSLVFPAPEAARLSGTLYRRDERSQTDSRRNWRPYYVILALYGTGIFALLVIVTLVF